MASSADVLAGLGLCYSFATNMFLKGYPLEAKTAQKN